MKDKIEQEYREKKLKYLKEISTYIYLIWLTLCAILGVLYVIG